MIELDIICPTLRRDDKLEALAKQVAENTITPHRLTFVAEDYDEPTIEQLERLGCEYIAGDYGGCAAAYNAGFDATHATAVFLANDDLEFPKGWELPALEVLEEFPIVGVNEGHGRMTCFSMVRRSYIYQHSGVYDEPATLVHPYKSQYVDTELAEYAKHRGVWGEARQGGVIHRHHDFGDADPNHPNYIKARSTLFEDQATYERRSMEWL